MGTASEGSDAGGIVGDCGVGTIVWVRRRNGSWWPGRILGPEELADSHVVSSRLGTPVKLLGREDASVDWYNLEKSKRVKPFRCGEFDACIERAETSHSTPIKKREKYARREDAILHALELEKQQLEMQQESTAISCHAPNKTIGLSERGSNHYSSELNVSNMSQTSSRKISPLLDKCHLDHPLPIHGNRNIKMRISEEEKHEISTHISVEDVSPEVSKSKGRVFLSVVGGNSDITDDDHSDLIPDSAQNSGFISQAVTDKNFSVFKRKTLLPSAINDSPTKKRDRRRPLVKVLQNSTKLPVSYSFQPHHDCSGSFMPSEEHLISKAHGTQKNTLHRSLDADDPLDYLSHSWKHTTVDSGNAYQLQQPGCLSNESTPSRWTEENDFDSSATDSEPEMVEEKLRSGITQPLKHTAESSIESGMSHWHLKGKRNNRVISKRLHKYGDGNKLDGANNSNVLFMETSPKGKATTSYNIGKFDSSTTPNALGPEFSSEKEIDYDSEDEEIFTGLGNKRDDLERQHSDYIDSDDDEQLISEPGWGPMRPFQIWKAYWDDPEDNLDQFCAPPFGYRMIPMLIDVDLKVQARYHGEHVPLISLMSKLNGMAIVGHPVHIEVLEDGSTDLLLPSMEFGDTAASPIWRTAKRTSMHRLPRSIPDPPNSSYVDDKSQSDLQTPTAKKRFYHASRSASGRFQRKPLKTVSLFSSQKTRALSSFVREKKHYRRGVFLDGLVKADGSMPPVTCIPAKVVFSRILESLARPSAHRAIAACAAERGPS